MTDESTCPCCHTNRGCLCVVTLTRLDEAIAALQHIKRDLAMGMVQTAETTARVALGKIGAEP